MLLAFPFTEKNFKLILGFILVNSIKDPVLSQKTTDICLIPIKSQGTGLGSFRFILEIMAYKKVTKAKSMDRCWAQNTII